MEMKHLSAAVFYLSIKILFCHSKGRLTLHHDCNTIPSLLQSHHHHHHHHHYYIGQLRRNMQSPHCGHYQSSQIFGRIVAGMTSAEEDVWSPLTQTSPPEPLIVIWPSHNFSHQTLSLVTFFQSAFSGHYSFLSVYDEEWDKSSHTLHEINSRNSVFICWICWGGAGVLNCCGK